jgi:hypothetical protein
MATVELHVANELLPDFDAIRPKINGREIGRRPSPTAMGITILEMEMPDAPSQARTMELVMRLVDGQPEISETHYWDEHGIFLAPVVPFPGAVN